ncbi:chemotaxis protein CheW [Desulfovirgula thermocuniculi]|uniref:chemotaxis protein CheW n=1 Tax=Desulfovirgula thermocuniculi TaxID=348842 RepID=UPI000412EAD0|nr:chemotaxis protein CheW [Desulfovirgula thermocuniculi]
MGGGSKQYVVFRLAEESYGIAIEYLQEIIRVPAVVRVPLAPPYIKGLANLRGTILTVYDTRVRLGLPSGNGDEGSRVVVVRFKERQAGFIVDRVDGVVDVPLSSVEEFRREEGNTAGADLITRAAKLEDRLVLLLEPGGLFGSAGEESCRGGSGVTFGGAAAGQEEGARQVEEEKQLLTFRVGGEEYGLDIADVKEIVHLPEKVNFLPGAPPYVLGVISLRQKVLPLLSLRRLFGLPEEEGGRVVVAYLGAGRNLLAGLVVDSVAEVLRVSEKSLEPVPGLFRDRENGEVSAVCRVGEDRLVFVVDASKLVSEEALSVTAGGAEEGSEEGRRHSEAEQHLVTFLLAGEEFALPIASVREIIRGTRVTPVPGSLPFVCGVLNLRGTIVPVVDLRLRFAYPPKELDEQSRILICEGRSTVLGLLVDGVREVLKVPLSQVEPAPDIVVAGLQRCFVSGIAKLDASRNVLILDSTQVLSWEEEEYAASLAEAESVGKEDTRAGS